MPQRLTAASLADELRAQFNLEKGLLKTAVELTVRPATMLTSYLDGTQRRNYVGVVAYFVLAISVTLAAHAIVGYEDDLVQETRTESPELDDIGISDEEFWSFEETVIRHWYFAVYLYLPVAALATLWFFRFWGLSYLEHLVINAFVIAHSEFINLPLYLAYIFLPFAVAADFQDIGSGVIGYIYPCFVYFLLTRLHRRAGYLRDMARSATATAFQLVAMAILVLMLWVSINLGFGAWRAIADFSGP